MQHACIYLRSGAASKQPHSQTSAKSTKQVLCMSRGIHLAHAHLLPQMPERERESGSERETARVGERERDRESGRERERQRETETEGERERQRGRERETEREREREREMGTGRRKETEREREREREV